MASAYSTFSSAMVMRLGLIYKKRSAWPLTHELRSRTLALLTINSLLFARTTMNIQPAIVALKWKRRLEIRYDGYVRVVEVDACGYTSQGNVLMRVWQVRGGVSVVSAQVGSCYGSMK